MKITKDQLAAMKTIDETGAYEGGSTMVIKNLLTANLIEPKPDTLTGWQLTPAAYVELARLARKTAPVAHRLSATERTRRVREVVGPEPAVISSSPSHRSYSTTVFTDRGAEIAARLVTALPDTTVEARPEFVSVKWPEA